VRGVKPILNAQVAVLPLSLVTAPLLGGRN
jgi:hypothetical protein